MIIRPAKEQDKGIAHCHYILQLTNEIWCKENQGLLNKKMSWNDCLVRAFQLHRKKLITNRVNKVVPPRSSFNPRSGW